MSQRYVAPRHQQFVNERGHIKSKVVFFPRVLFAPFSTLVTGFLKALDVVKGRCHTKSRQEMVM